MFSPATKVVVIAEQLLEDGIVAILKAGGAKGYTVVPGAGEGEHLDRKGGRSRASVVSGFSIVRIEFIMADSDKAHAIAEEVARRYFEEYSGIVYVSEVEVIRAERF